MSARGAYFALGPTGYEATELTRGPWDPSLQHAGPATALLAREVERHPDAADACLARLTIELLRPLPVGGCFTIDVSPGRRGRKVRGLELTLRQSGRDMVRASALLMRRTELTLPLGPPPAAIAGVASSEPWRFPFFREAVGYHTSMELRRADGAFGGGRMAVWFRLLADVVAGETPTPLQRLAAAADSGNGVSVALDLARYTFVNPDLTIALLRPPQGEWFALDAQTLAVPASTGMGLSDTRLWDEAGVVGRGVQTLLIEPRS